ncbi:hypothetical protein L596_016474 [Steinernema carpocapsae]|uniref:acireductone dioxygenase (Fe(2+)-requiring) n=1 Tax=Steinernema carpocapsae TaxID=34508 RepID=A0A4V6A3E2_STECR|nr:hypothetical protein L596_016474 [Steinernema carpocapsae]
MVRAWYLSDKVEDQRDECHRDPPEFCGLEKLSEVGFYYRYVIENRTEGLKKVTAEFGYDYQDEITINQEQLPDYEIIIKKFFNEHIHKDDEARYIVDGSGYFDVRDKEVQTGGFVSLLKRATLALTAGVYHRFTVDSNDYVHAVRFFPCLGCFLPWRGD